METIVLPDSLRKIQASAFEGCIRLRRVVLPAGLETVGNRAFAGCTALEEVDFQGGFPRVSVSTFEGCSGLRAVTLPDSLREIGPRAFYSCAGLESIRLPQDLRSIGEEAFRGAGIQELMLPPKLEPIGVKAFAAEEYGSGAAVLKSIQISVGNPHFRIEDGFLLRQKEDGTCSLMCAFGEDKTVTVPENVSEIEPLAFCYSVVKEVRLPAFVTDVAMDAFLQCRNLARLRLEFPQPENDLRWVVFYFPEKQDENEEGEESCNDYTIRKQYLDCIRTGRDGVFEVVKYDSLFPSIQGFQGPGADRYGPPEIRRPDGAAVPGRIPELAAGQRRRGGGDCHRVRRPGWPEYPGGAGHIRRGNIDQSIELANSAQKPEILSYLMNYKNAHIGISETDYDLRVRRDAVDRQKRAEELAIQILRYARNELLVALRFLDLALCRPEYQPGDLETFALDGEYLSFNPDFIFALYRQGGGELNHSYLHAILH